MGYLLRWSSAVPEIYNRAMAKEWAELASRKPIKLEGLMTQYPRGLRSSVPSSPLAAVTNITSR